MPSLCQVQREVYMKSPHPHVAVSLGGQYVGPGLRREERRGYTSTSDWSDTMCVRYSDDNGRTWTEWELLDRKWPSQGDYTKSQSRGGGLHDPVSGRTFRSVFQRILPGDPQHALSEAWKGNLLYHDHGFWQASQDEGRTWGPIKQLKYEDGPSFDPDNWGDPEFLSTNEMYVGYHPITLGDGLVFLPVVRPVPFYDEEDRVVDDMVNLTGREKHVAGIMGFLGRWDPGRRTYQWTTSEPLVVPRRVSWRGLLEPEAAQLESGDVLLVMRGSNTKVTPGRKWMSVSKDGGNTWSPVTDLRYDTGEPFYSPSSPCGLIRSSKTGKLYWVGNITQEPPDGNSPRYPLYIAEVDETIPALKRDSLTLIDGRDPKHDSVLLQVTNFSLFENRETEQFELYLTRLGERGDGKSCDGDFWTADSYKYVLSL